MHISSGLVTNVLHLVRCIQLQGDIVACDIFFIGGQPCVTNCDRGEGSNLVTNLVTKA